MNNRSVFGALWNALRRRPAQLMTAATGGVIILAGLVASGPSLGANLTEIVGGLITLAGLALGTGLGPPPLSPDDLVPRLRKEVRDRWRAEAYTRGLLERDYVPVQLTVDGAPAPVRDEADRDGPAWRTVQFERVVLDVYLGAPSPRLLVTGDRGGGKSVFSVMLTLGILDPDATRATTTQIGPQRLPVPLPISISSWRPHQETFAKWFDRRLVRAYPTIRLVRQQAGQGPVWTLLNSGDYVPILDGLDEIPAPEREQGVRQLEEYFSQGRPVVILSRDVGDLRNAFPDLTKVRLLPVTPDRAARYFEHLEARHGVSTGPLAANLRSATAGNLASLLGRPMYIDLVESVLSNGQVTTEDLLTTASGAGVDVLRNILIRSRILLALRAIRSGGRRRARHLTYLARQMTAFSTAVLPWWRLVDWMPASILVASTALVATVPSYLLALRMPIGLTRGLAIGVIAGIAFGVLRGRPIRWPDLTLLGASMPVAIAIEGWLVVGGRQGIADGIEITTATVLAFRYRDSLFGPPFMRRAEPSGSGALPLPPGRTVWASSKDLAAGAPARHQWEYVAVLVAIALVTSAVTATSSEIMSFHDHDRNPVTIFIAALFGLGVASAAARLMIVGRERMEPSTVLLRIAPRVGGLIGAYRAGLVSAMTIGIGGGIGGGLRLGLIYGAMLMIVFGIVVGVPVGLVGGVIRWLSAPVTEHSPARNRPSPSTLRTDRTVSIAAVVGIGAAAAAGIGLLTGPLSEVAATIDRLSSFTIVPADGILFGFSIGTIVACFYTAWQAYLLTHTWLTLLRRAPVRLTRFFEDLHGAEILRREGSYVLFRHLEYQAYLSSHGEEFVAAFESRQDGWAELAGCQLPARHPGNRRATDGPAAEHPPQPTPEPASTNPHTAEADGRYV